FCIQLWIPHCPSRFQRSLRRGDFGGIKFQFRIICERLSYERRRRRLIRRNRGVLRARRSNAGDQHTNEKSQNILPHNWFTTAISTKHTARRRKRRPTTLRTRIQLRGGRRSARICCRANAKLPTASQFRRGLTTVPRQ